MTIFDRYDAIDIACRRINFNSPGRTGGLSTRFLRQYLKGYIHDFEGAPGFLRPELFKFDI
ncbi:hypothetical protein QUB77_23170 [Microcoleus sp. AT9b-C3]